ncbi:MAG: zinc ribbon domain-containing protein [Acidobacteria bacterium]|nr:zinc ribbon domain-containing protein [Acidobacteriota bacterium]
MKKCLACGNDNPDEMAFCLQCGKPVSAPATSGWSGEDQSTVALSSGPPTVPGNSVETRFYGRGFTVSTEGGGPAGTQSAVAVPQKSRTGLIFGVLAGVVVLFVIGAVALVGGYFYLNRGTVAVVANANSNTASPKTGNTNSVSNSNTIANTNSAPNPTPVPSFTPPTEASKTGTFTVNANAGWQLSNIDTVPLEEFTTNATGTVDVVGVKAGLGPKGVNDNASKSRRLIPEFPTGALLMRTRYADGNFSNVQAVLGFGTTGSWRNEKQERGKIEFCVNDNAPQNNAGQFIVNVKMTKVPKTN